MSRYRKAIVALAGFVLIILNDFLNFGIASEQYNESIEQMVNGIIGLAMVIGVYQVPNRSGS